jgi:Ser/Thr protein kinase RdoA (MazF antagonist)
MANPIPETLIEMVETRYELSGVTSVRPLEGGECNQVLRLSCEQGAFVVRISPPGTVPESMTYEHELMAYMQSQRVPVPRPIAGHDGSTWFLCDSQLVTLFPFMPGRMADREHPSDRQDAARVLARIHQAALRYPDRSPRPGFGYPPLWDLDWDRNCLWDWSAVRDFLARGAEGPGGSLQEEPPEVTAASKREIVARLPQIERERETMRAWVARLAASGRRLQVAPVHGDYYRRNLLVEEGRVTAVLDWEDCQLDWVALELGRAVWEFCKCKRRHILLPARARAFLSAYQEAGGPVPETDFDLLLPFIRCALLIDALTDLGNAVPGEAWDAEYTWHNLRSLENLTRGPLLGGR